VKMDAIAATIRLPGAKCGCQSDGSSWSILRGRRLAARAVDRHVPRIKDDRLWVYGVGEDGVTAFTEDGIENLRQIIVDERTAGRAPPSIKPAK
jgi:hypothetical protein